MEYPGDQRQIHCDREYVFTTHEILLCPAVRPRLRRPDDGLGEQPDLGTAGLNLGRLSQD